MCGRASVATAVLAVTKWSMLTLKLGNAEEIENGKSNGALGEIFIRCNNVLYIRSALSSGLEPS